LIERNVPPNGLCERAPDVHGALDARWRSFSVAFLGGLALVLLANAPLFSTNVSVPWDARDSEWLHFRWLGSALRAGYFGDFFPNIMSGFSEGTDLQPGLYNPLYALVSFLFYDSALSVNLVYLLLQCLLYATAYGIGLTFSFEPPVAAFLGLSFVASGFVTGHASHLGFLSSAVGVLCCFWAIRIAESRPRSAMVIALLGTWHMCTAGYPTIVIFGAQVLAVYALVLLLERPCRLAGLTAAAAGGFAGLLFASPALIHLWHEVRLTPRGAGLSVNEALWGSLPPRSIVNMLLPHLHSPGGRLGVDPTLDRFHLLYISVPCVVVALFSQDRGIRRLSWTLCGAAAFFLLLALGNNSPFPLRAFLTEHVALYRIGRFPSADHRGFALFCIAVASCFGLQAIKQRLERRPAMTLGLTLVIVLDFMTVMAATGPVRYTSLPVELRGRMGGFKVEYAAADQHFLDAPRGCPFETSVVAESRATFPFGFSWAGYVSSANAQYLSDRDSLRWALCGPSRLWDADSHMPVAYQLVSYSPARIEFMLVNADSLRGRLLLWAEQADGYWQLSVDGQPRDFETGPASLRYFHVPASVAHLARIVMTYRGPLSRAWR